MDLEFKRLMESGDQLVGFHTTKEEVSKKTLMKLPEITPWSPPFDVQQLCSEIGDMKRISAIANNDAF